MIELEILSTSLGCSRCEHAMKIIKNVATKYKGKIKIVETDIAKKPEKLIKFKIMSTPAIIINGKLAFEGTPNEKELEKKIQEALR